MSVYHNSIIHIILFLLPIYILVTLGLSYNILIKGMLWTPRECLLTRGNVFNSRECERGPHTSTVGTGNTSLSLMALSRALKMSAVLRVGAWPGYFSSVCSLCCSNSPIDWKWGALRDKFAFAHFVKRYKTQLESIRCLFAVKFAMIAELVQYVAVWRKDLHLILCKIDYFLVEKRLWVLRSDVGKNLCSHVSIVSGSVCLQ